ncbi:MAG: hypothetical protein KA116_03210 [Proteobacteria bacterium]|nr:hypothetical protein [Pseudomonadota bacterium]
MVLTGGLSKVNRWFLLTILSLSTILGFADDKRNPFLLKIKETQGLGALEDLFRTKAGTSDLINLGKISNGAAPIYLVDVSDGYLPFFKEDVNHIIGTNFEAQDIRHIIQNSDKRSLAPKSDSGLINFVSNLEKLSLEEVFARLAAIDRLSNREEHFAELSNDVRNQIADSLFLLLTNELLPLEKLLLNTDHSKTPSEASILRNIVSENINVSINILLKLKSDKSEALILSLLEKSEDYPLLLTALSLRAEELFTLFDKQLRKLTAQNLEYLFIEPKSRDKHPENWNANLESLNLSNFPFTVKSVSSLSLQAGRATVFSIDSQYRPRVLLSLLGNPRLPNRAKILHNIQDAFNAFIERNIRIRGTHEDATAIEAIHQQLGAQPSIDQQIEFFNRFAANPKEVSPDYAPINIQRLFQVFVEELFVTDNKNSSPTFQADLYLSTAFRISRNLLTDASRDLATQLYIADHLINAWKQNFHTNLQPRTPELGYQVHSSISALFTTLFYSLQMKGSNELWGDSFVQILAAEINLRHESAKQTDSASGSLEAASWSEYLIRELNMRSRSSHLPPLSPIALDVKEQLSQLFPEAAERANARNVCEEALE